MFTFKDWKELASFTLTSVQLFNRKRAGEIERITIEDFKTCQEINENELENFLSSQDKPSTSNQKYVRFLIRGKKARGVPVLLTQLMSKAINLILKHRDE